MAKLIELLLKVLSSRWFQTAALWLIGRLFKKKVSSTPPPVHGGAASTPVAPLALEVKPKVAFIPDPEFGLVEQKEVIREKAKAANAARQKVLDNMPEFHVMSTDEELARYKEAEAAKRADFLEWYEKQDEATKKRQRVKFPKIFEGLPDVE